MTTAQTFWTASLQGRLAIAFSTFMLLGSSSLAQNTLVPWSAFDMGFASSSAANTAVMSVAGQAFAGPSQAGNTVVNSGFLAYPFPIYARIKVFLQGPFNVSAMNTTLKSTGTLASHFTGVSIPAEAVDSINIEIRNTTSGSGSSIRRFKPAWLLSNGSIRDFVDTTRTSLPFDPPAGSYFLVVRHRNHLTVMTATGQSLSLDPPASAYDFTTLQSQAWGTSPMKALGSAFGMIAGDADGSGDIGALDRNATWNDRTLLGYLSSDVDLSGDVGALDRNITWNNRTLVTQVP